MSDWNRGIIEEFRANAGKVGGRFDGLPLLLLHHRGAKSQTERVNPLAYQDLGSGAVAVFASKGGAPTNPDWYHNVRANPAVRVEIGDQLFGGVARVAEGEERGEIWERQKGTVRGFATYEGKTERQIPVVIIEGLTVAEPPR
ncbi:MAG TPA: nitroreductase family deazaflavin-dependent oxidoreductase [Actinomycetota bacterium]